MNFAPVLDIGSNPNNPVCFAARMTNGGKPGKCLPHARTPFASSVCAVATLQRTVRDVVGATLARSDPHWQNNRERASRVSDLPPGGHDGALIA